jgi:2-desacetyl-2-hydroxyethyl bacteriochlorophyllide A dehydrogenase
MAATAEILNSKGIVFTGKNQVEIADSPVQLEGEGKLLIETQKSLISIGTECICLSRNFAPGTHWDGWVQYPFSTGYSNAGRVVEVSPDVTEFKPGDRVATRSKHAQYVVADAATSLHIPENIVDEDATWFGLATIAQIGNRRAEHQLGDAVVIVGAGPVGQLAAQYARVGGAREVLVIDMSEARLAMAKAHGATMTLNMSVNDAEEAVREATEGRLADVVYDVTGHPAVFAPAIKLARRFGKMILLGDAGNPGEQRLTGDVITRGVKIIGAHDNFPAQHVTDFEPWSRPAIGRLFLTYLSRGQMSVHDLITHTYAPQDAPEAYGMLINDRSAAMGVIFDWTQLK